MNHKKPIVIIGGMGPQASASLYQLLTSKAVTLHGAVDNEDFPYTVLQSLSMPDFLSSQARQAESIEMLQKAAHIAAALNPSVVGMPCNTAHLFQSQMLEGVNIPFTSLIDTVVGSVSAAGLANVGLLASPTTIRTKLYGQALQRQDIDCVVPTTSQLNELETIIRSVIGGTSGEPEKRILANIAQDLVQRGAEGIVIGCTELPLVFNKGSVEQPVFDCLDLLANTLLDHYYRQ